MGRTETFAEVRFDEPQKEGALLTVEVTGHDGRSLFGTPIAITAPENSAAAPLGARIAFEESET